MKSLTYYRKNQNDWSDFDYVKDVDDTAFTCNRYRILLELQYDWKASDHTLIQYIFQQEVLKAKAYESKYLNIYESYDLASFLLAKFKNPNDIPLFIQAKHANFDTGCGYDREYFHVALKEKTDEYLEKYSPNIYSEVRGNYEEYNMKSYLAEWWKGKIEDYPSNREDVSLYEQFRQAILLQDNKLAREFLEKWIEETKESKEKQRLLISAYNSLEDYAKVFEISKNLRVKKEQSLWDKASELKGFIELANKAKAYKEGLEFARELAEVFSKTTEWYNIGLGRMAKGAVFTLARYTEDKDIALVAFKIADKWYKENSDIVFSGLENAWIATQNCGLIEEEIYYKKMLKKEADRIGVEFPLSPKNIEKELLDILLSYNKQDDFYSFIDVVMSLSKDGLGKEVLLEILNNILGKLDKSQIIQDDIVGDILDYMTAWATPQKNTKRYNLFIHFNPDRVE